MCSHNETGDASFSAGPRVFQYVKFTKSTLAVFTDIIVFYFTCVMYSLYHRELVLYIKNKVICGLPVSPTLCGSEPYSFM